MNSFARSAKLAWAKLPPGFRRIRLELAREKEHPEGSSSIGYTLVAPLDGEGHIDPDLWRQFHEFCRVTRFRAGEADRIGQLVRRRGGAWALAYEEADDGMVETGYHFGSECFVNGEYVSIKDGTTMHRFKVASVEPL
jgi:hypothetical protein